jgi:hypothetical protein
MKLPGLKAGVSIGLARLRRITSASLRAPFIPRFKSLGFSGRSYKSG